MMNMLYIRRILHLPHLWHFYHHRCDLRVADHTTALWQSSQWPQFFASCWTSQLAAIQMSTVFQTPLNRSMIVCLPRWSDSTPAIQVTIGHWHRTDFLTLLRALTNQNRTDQCCHLIVSANIWSRISLQAIVRHTYLYSLLHHGYLYL